MNGKVRLIRKKVRRVQKTMPQQGRGEILSDVTGSYTGMGVHGEAPVQDADDL